MTRLLRYPLLLAVVIGGSLAGWYVSVWAAVAALVLIAAVVVLHFAPGGDS